LVGTPIREAINDRIRVTVIATGFSAAAPRSAALEPEKTDAAEIIPYEQWAAMGKAGSRTHPEEFLLGRNSREADLSVPTVLREKRIAGQKD
jgi:cell division protein FtsZ